MTRPKFMTAQPDSGLLTVHEVLRVKIIAPRSPLEAGAFRLTALCGDVVDRTDLVFDYLLDIQAPDSSRLVPCLNCKAIGSNPALVFKL